MDNYTYPQNTTQNIEGHAKRTDCFQTRANFWFLHCHVRELVLDSYNVFTDHRRAMLHVRKAQVVQLAFERDLTRKCINEWKGF